MPSLGMRQYTTFMAGNVLDGADVISQILAEGEDYYDQGTAYLLKSNNWILEVTKEK
jgi:hypothetical protein